MNTDTPGTALDRGLNELRKRQDALEERNADLESRVAALEGVSPPVDAVETKSLDIADIQKAVDKAQDNNLPVLLKDGTGGGKGTVRVTKPVTVFAEGQTFIEDTDTSREMWERPWLLCEAPEMELYGFTVKGPQKRRESNRAAFFYAPRSCKLYAHHMVISEYTGAAFQVRNQVDPLLIDQCELEDLWNFEGEDRNMGYGLALYGDPNTWDKQQNPLARIERCKGKNVRHLIAINNSGWGRAAHNEIVNTKDVHGAGLDIHHKGKWKRPGRYLELENNTVETGWFGAGLRGGTSLVWDNDFTKSGKGGEIGVTSNGDSNKAYWPRVYIWGNKNNDFQLYGGSPQEVANNVHQGPPDFDWPIAA